MNDVGAATILAVAQQARVSRQTVSNVMNHPERVAPATRARVLEAIQDLGYSPSGIARALRTGRPAQLFVHARNASHWLLLELIQAGAEHDAYVSVTSEPASGRRRQRPDIIVEGDALHAGGQRLDYDIEPAVSALVAHLVGVRRRHVALVGSEKSCERIRSWSRRLTQFGSIYPGTFGAAWQSALQSLTPQSALLALDAATTASALYEARLNRCLRGVEIIGFDEHRSLPEPMPRLIPPYATLAREAVRAALGDPTGDIAPRLEFEPGGPRDLNRQVPSEQPGTYAGQPALPG